MLRENSVKLTSLKPDEVISILKDISAGSVSRYPIKKAVKVFCRRSSEGSFTYARETFDLGTTIISKEDISLRLSHPSLQESVLSALTAFELSLGDDWPFMLGSHSWLEMEIECPSLAPGSTKSITITRAVRLSSLNRDNIKMSRLSSRVLEACLSHSTHPEWKIKHSTERLLPPPPGALEKYESSEISLPELINFLLEANESLAGVYIFTNDKNIRVVSSSLEKQDKKNLPIPIAGVLK